MLANEKLPLGMVRRPDEWTTHPIGDQMLAHHND